MRYVLKSDLITRRNAVAMKGTAGTLASYWFFDPASGGTVHPVQGTIEAVGVVSGALKQIHSVAGGVNAVSIVSGSGGVVYGITGSIQALEVVTSALGNRQGVSGQVDAVSVLSGLAGLSLSVSGVAEAVSEALGEAGYLYGLAGASEAVAEASGGLSIVQLLAGQVDAVSEMRNIYVWLYLVDEAAALKAQNDVIASISVLGDYDSAMSTEYLYSSPISTLDDSNSAIIQVVSS